MLRTIQITSMTSSVPFAPVISWRKRFKFKKLMDTDAKWWQYLIHILFMKSVIQFIQQFYLISQSAMTLYIFLWYRHW
jgi:hypothetical protein